MTSQKAMIAIQQTPGRQEIQQPRAELSIQQPKAEISMSTTPSKLRIDQTQAWEDMNLMHIFKRIEKFANDGHQGLMEGIARRVRQGDELMKIENKGNPIAGQAIENGFDQMKSLGIKFIPSMDAVKIHYQPSDLKIDVKVNKPRIEAEAHKPLHEYHRGNVSISMKQFSNLDINFANLYI
ncbi:DUF6470 family protein [Virgibacillus oceani]|nr:DUF6470 family protein [Virgibacillus oceani]